VDNKMYLICDCVGSADIQILNESNGSSMSSGPIRFRGKFQEADTLNKNRRRYGYPTLNREVGRLAEAIGERRLVGELDHPDNSIIHYENASHLITKLWWENKVLMGEGEILSTPAGQILEGIIKAGIPIGISSRGVGSGKTTSEGVMEIDENFRLITFDVVADPSTHSAYAGPIGESKKPKQESTQQKNIEKITESCVDTKIDSKILVGYLGSLFSNKS
jgi:hypothetical protein